MTEDRLRREGLTHQEWLNSASDGLPEGFREWKEQYRHWDQHNPIGWAISCFLDEAKKHKGYKESKPRPQKRTIPTLEDLRVIADILNLEIEELEIQDEFDGKDTTTGLPYIFVRYPGDIGGTRIFLDEYGQYWASSKIPGVPCKVIRTWPTKSFLIDI